VLITGGHYGRAWSELLRHSLTPVLHDPGQVEALADEIRYAGSEPIGVHVKIDTGMSRLGVTGPELPRLAAALARHPEVRLEGLMTHFASADSGDLPSIEGQLDRFDEATAMLRAHGLVPKLRHAANSAALLRSERALLDLVRPGLALFGVEPCPGQSKDLRPVMRVQSEIVAMREVQAGTGVGYGGTWVARRTSRIATVPIGYADGLPRALSNEGRVLVRGKRAPIVGAVSMDMTMLDVTEVEGARVGDECCVLGSQKGPLGEDSITATEIADQLGTIPWEVLTNVSRRVPRFYREP
jgi:alanine racemase